MQGKQTIPIIKEQVKLEQGLPQVPVLRGAFLPPGSLLPADPLALINRLNIGFWLCLEQMPTENTGILPTRENIPVNRVQLPTTRITAFHIDWARHKLTTH